MNQSYLRAINDVLVYIEENLQGDLSLKKISGVAFYSPFHVHRLFRAITNETLNAYISRKRVEQAVLQLIHNPEFSITEIAMHCGFGSNSSFSRSFKKYYGESPGEFRKSNLHNFSKIGKVNSKNGKVNVISGEYLRNIEHLQNFIKMKAKIEIREMPEMKMAYITQIGVDGIENAFERILKWARPKGLLTDNNAFIVRVFHDSFKITDEDKVRMSIGVTSNKEIRSDGEIAISKIEKGKNIVGRFEIEPAEFEHSWNGLFIWMHEQGYKKANRFPFEIYHNDYRDHPEKKCIVDLCIPVE